MLGMAMRRNPRDSAVLARGARVQRQVAVLVPGRRAKHSAAQRGARRRGVDGRVGRVLLRHEPRCGCHVTVCGANIFILEN